MSGTPLSTWEAALRRTLDRVDHALEDRFGELFTRRATRPARQSTANPKYDGLFAVDGKFSLGLISRSGPGYVIDITIATDTPLAAAARDEVLAVAEEALGQALRQEFPERHFDVQREGRVLRLTGDLSL